MLKHHLVTVECLLDCLKILFMNDKMLPNLQIKIDDLKIIFPDRQQIIEKGE